MPSIANSERFQWLKELKFRIHDTTHRGTTSQSTSTGSLHSVDSFIDVADIVVDYSDSVSTGALSTIASNNLLAVVLGGTAADVGLADHCQCSVKTHVRYTDY